MRVPRTVMAVGGVVVAAALIGFTNPKAVQAVTAALVQVTNTATNPVVTQGVGQQAANTVHLNCLVYMDSSTSGTQCAQILSNGQYDAGTYTVPAGQTLVINAVDLLPGVFNCAGDYQVTLRTSGAFANIQRWSTSSSPVTTHFVYPSGPTIAAGFPVEMYGEAVIPGSGSESCPTGTEVVDLTGYLTAA